MPVSLPQSIPPVPTISSTTQQQATTLGVTAASLANSPSSPSQAPADDTVSPITTQHTSVFPPAHIPTTVPVPPDQPTGMFPPPLATSGAAANTTKPCYEFPPVPKTSPVRMLQGSGSASPVPIPSGGSYASEQSPAYTCSPRTHVSAASKASGGVSSARLVSQKRRFVIWQYLDL